MNLGHGSAPVYRRWRVVIACAGIISVLMWGYATLQFWSPLLVTGLAVVSTYMLFIPIRRSSTRILLWGAIAITAILMSLWFRSTHYTVICEGGSDSDRWLFHLRPAISVIKHSYVDATPASTVSFWIAGIVGLRRWTETPSGISYQVIEYSFRTWLLLLPSLFVACTVVGVLAYRQCCRHRRDRQLRCKECGYMLRVHSSVRCSECGSPIVAGQ